MRGPLGRAVYRGDRDFVAGYLCARFDFEIPLSEVDQALDLVTEKKLRLCGCWSDSTWVMWFNNRLGWMFCSGRVSPPVEIRFTCEMNTFFLSLEESDEMLKRLRRPDDLEDRRNTLREARSKISKSTLRELHPIDSVAAKVSHINKLLRGEHGEKT